VILDRDGTLVVDRGYLGDPAGLEFEPGAVEGLQWLYARSYRLIVISNQSGVGRGYFPLDRLHAMNARLNTMVESVGVRLEGIYCCPHAPEANCSCRKPALGLMKDAASELEFDPAAAVVVGDKETDIEFGRRAGAITVLISLQETAASLSSQATIVAPNLLHAARAITALRSSYD
jgi:D-glycero-D-manno-heptose 1,7-bisphosphate phosphatase